VNDYKATYKTRAEAFRLFIQAQGLPCSQAKFYQDCDRLNLMRQDKTIHLADMMAYVRSELQVNPTTGITLVEKDREREKQDLEIRKLRAEIEARELTNRKEDAKWLLKDDAFAQMAAIFGLLRDTLRHHFHLGQSALVLQAGGDQSRAPEVYEGVESILSAAFNDVAGLGSLEVLFDGDEDA